MRRTLATVTIAGALALTPAATATAHADDVRVSTPVVAQSELEQTEIADEDGDDFGDWGLLGLLGLFGLFGYKKYKDHRATRTATHPTDTDGTTGTSRRV